MQLARLPCDVMLAWVDSHPKRGRMHRFNLRNVLFAAVMLSSPVTFAGDAKTDAKKPAAADAKKPAPTAKAKTPPAPKKKPAPPVSAEHKKALAELLAGFKFGMSKDEVVTTLTKHVDERFDEKIKATTDIAAQDRLRREKRTELARVTGSYTSFEGKKTGWDVSIVENEFAHNTNEAMLEHWENQDGKNQRRFFFFYEGKLWKMFVQLDVSILPEDKKNFETFQSVMSAKYGAGDVDPGKITWRTDAFHVRAIDRLKDYGALAISIEDPKVEKGVLALREAKAPPKQETASVIKAVIDPDKKDHPDVKSNNDAVDTVIKAHGGSTDAKPAPPPPKP